MLLIFDAVNGIFYSRGYEQGNVEYGIYDLGHREPCKKLKNAENAHLNIVALL